MSSIQEFATPHAIPLDNPVEHASQPGFFLSGVFGEKWVHLLTPFSVIYNFIQTSAAHTSKRALASWWICYCILGF